MFFWNKFCGFILTFLLIASFSDAQNARSIRLSENSFFQKNNLFNSGSVHFRVPVYASNQLMNTGWDVPEDFYTKHMGFFCKKELIIEKAIKIPLRFRLGSLQQCNYYEGKKQ